MTRPSPTFHRRRSRSAPALKMPAVAALLAFAGLAAATSLAMAAEGADPDVASRIEAVTPRVVAWRRDIHQHPELGNQERRTAALVAAHLKRLGLDEVRTGIAHTGVLGVLKGGRPGGVVALRADMDALPIKEATGLPFASTATATVGGEQVPVMHACGHDANTAVLMGAAEVLAGMRERIPGTVLFVFQPAEEGVAGEEAGAALMLKEGLFADHRPQVIFGLHMEPGQVGRIDARPGPFLSAATTFDIRLQGRQTHGARPWEGVDVINLGADVIKALTTISARSVDVFDTPSVVTVGTVQAGNRHNIIPGEAMLGGTIRTYSIERRDRLKDLATRVTEGLAANYGATAKVAFEDVTLVTRNDPALLQAMMPALEQAAGAAGVNTEAPLRAAAEDFSFLQQDIPGLYYILGSTPRSLPPGDAPSNHSDRFDIDEAVLPVGVKAHVLTTLRFLEMQARE